MRTKIAQNDWSALDASSLPEVTFDKSDPQTVDQICIGFPQYIQQGSRNWPLAQFNSELKICGERDDSSNG
jgi:hypothetical protein